MKGVTFGDYHSYNDLRLLLTSKEIGSPTVKTKKIDIEGADGALDFTDFFGEAKYENVTHKFQFSTLVAPSEFLTLFSEIKNKLHGKKSRIILDDDPSFFYTGRCFVSKFTNEKNVGIVSIECDCEPWKYKANKTHQVVTLGGKNMIDLDSAVSIPSNGWVRTETGYSFLRGNVVGGVYAYFTMYVVKGLTYTFSAVGTHGSEPIYLYVYKERVYGTPVKNSSNGGAVVFTPEESGVYIFALIVNSTTSAADYTNIMLEIGNTGTEYEAFDSTEKTINVVAPNLRKRVVPQITASKAVTVSKDGVSAALAAGTTYTIAEFELSEGDNTFQITGSGAMVAFEYQEGGL